VSIPVVDQVRRVPALAWILIALVAVIVVKTWHAYACDDQDRSWLDPQQPPVNVDIDMRATAAAVLAPTFRAPKLYPWSSLSQHPGCWVGDC
jgi:hypothetical protein